jgi:hypothetical protein
MEEVHGLTGFGHLGDLVGSDLDGDTKLQTTATPRPPESLKMRKEKPPGLGRLFFAG